ncbi:MAG: hypothetical protein CMN55_01315 [Sneathiella sp.]|jgi:hypothetical protein|uniref:WbqC family protein n=1 Tax=Sneathiella sp. TaxID=1964365 RepID=UPI000C512058|nr:WbqC family protein [Sneathiella sp.]MAL77747.1 hypothetical protein [Sneathiella sp.]|tara:strand:+ start:484 stop:1176 length:693 start_codon:yes stop_codon:yes gene_type:complete
MRVAIVQSNYLPWKGYFDLIASVDCFVLYDDAQFTRRDWRNRNIIKTPQGLQWLTVPVLSKNKYFQKINDTRIENDAFAKKHWRSIEANYNKARHFQTMAELIRPFFEGPIPDCLSDINADLTHRICRFLGINTKILSSSDFDLEEGVNERLLCICRQLKADVYVSGPLAKDYLDVELFGKDGVAVEWFDYSGYPVYEQLWGDFEHGVSVIDLIANTGEDAPKFMKQVAK